MKNFAKSRGALKRGTNWKADCCVCGKPISNRMQYDYDDSNVTRYAHLSCSKKIPGNWEPTW